MKSSIRHTILISSLGLGLMILLAIFGPIVSPYAYDQGSNLQFSSPSLQHWLGTDIHGRDVLTRVLYGARISLMVGAVGALVSVTIGVLYGMVSGYIGGKVDEAMMRVVDVLYCLPRTVFAIGVIAVLDSKFKSWLYESSLRNYTDASSILLLFVVLGMIEWLTMARIVRGQVLSLKNRQFILASQVLGQAPIRIMFRHLLPNLAGIILVYLTLTIPSVILEESFLSFLGLGVQAPSSSWGTLLSDGASLLNPVKIYWWMLLGPATFMAITLLCLNFLGDALRDKFDPRNAR